MGLVEDEIIVDTSNWSTDSVKEVRICAGVCAAPRVPEGALPFVEADMRAWREESVSAMQIITGPLVALSITSDPLGSFPILGLTSGVVAALGLCLPAESLGPFRLMDRDGSEAIRFRSWSVGPTGDRLSEQAPRLIGCDLIIRPDIWESLVKLCSIPPLLHTVGR